MAQLAPCDEQGARFFDSHAHLQDARLRHCVDRVIEEARRAGVERIACNGCCEADWPAVLELAERHPDVVVPNFGLHPWWVAERSAAWLQLLRRLLESTPHAGLGECGLHRGRRPGLAGLDEQAKVIAQQLRLGKELHRPVSVHCVHAFGQLLELVQAEGPFPDGLILHSWLGSAELTQQLSRVDGVHFSVSGHTCSMAPAKLEPMLRAIPLERLLLETDTPDGLPEGEHVRTVEPLPEEAQRAKSGALNHPANIRVVLDIVAAATRTQRKALAGAAFRNAAAVFKL